VFTIGSCSIGELAPNFAGWITKNGQRHCGLEKELLHQLMGAVVHALMCHILLQLDYSTEFNICNYESDAWKNN